MCRDSRIFNLKSEDAWFKIVEYEVATLVSQPNRSSPIDEKRRLDNILPVK